MKETPKSAAPAATPVVTAEVAAPVRADGQSGAVTTGERRLEFVQTGGESDGDDFSSSINLPETSIHNMN